MFEDDIDIDFDELLNSSPPAGSSLKRQNSEVKIEEPRKKLKCSYLDKQSSNIIETTREKSNFHFKKLPKRNDDRNVNNENVTVPSASTKSPISPKNVETSRICIIRNTSKDNIRIRKFPGPAGLLPGRNCESLGIEETKRFCEIETKEDFCSQRSILLCEDGPWQQMECDFCPNKLSSEISLPDKYNIGWIKNRILQKNLINQKAPFLAVIINSIRSHSIQNPIVSLTLKDKTGTIEGTILHDLYEEYSSDLTVGSVIVLRGISVLNTGSNTEPYLTITSNNLVTIYTTRQESKSQDSSSQAFESSKPKITIQNLTYCDILNEIEDLKKFHKQEIENSKRKVQLYESTNSIKPINISNNFKEAVHKNKFNNTVPKVNLNNLKCGKSANKIETFPKEKQSESVELNNRNTTKLDGIQIADFFSDQDFDEFFNDEPNFCSTQVSPQKRTSLCEKIEEPKGSAMTNTINEVESIQNSKFNHKNNSFSCSSSSKEITRIIENIFEDVDANVLFDDF